TQKKFSIDTSFAPDAAGWPWLTGRSHADAGLVRISSGTMIRILRVTVWIPERTGSSTILPWLESAGSRTGFQNAALSCAPDGNGGSIARGLGFEPFQKLSARSMGGAPAARVSGAHNLAAVIR